jgi:DNA-binding response OmpR family regulator
MDGEKRILVVDDDEAIRALLMTILRRRGFAVDIARNGAEALDRLSRCRYAVMLLDLMMPIVNGWEVLQRLRDHEAATRPVIIVLTAGTEPRDLPADLVSGSVKKPFDVELLLDSVAACVATLGPRQQLPGCPPPDSSRKDSTKPS